MNDCMENKKKIQLFQLTLSDQSLKPTRQDRMAVWVEVDGCCTCRILMKYNDFVSFFFLFRHVKTKFFYATVNLRGILAIKTMQLWKKEKLPKNDCWEQTHSLHAPAGSCRLCDMQILVNTQTTIRSCRVGLRLWSDNVNWNSCKLDKPLRYLF